MQEIIKQDGFPAVEYTGDELAHGDTVWIGIPGLDGIGEWAEVDEDPEPAGIYVSARFWGCQYPTEIARVNIKFSQVHSCECGRTGPTSWRIYHPDA